MINFSVRARALAGKCSQDTSATGHCPVHGGAPAGRCSQDSSATGHCVERRKTNLC